MNQRKIFKMFTEFGYGRMNVFIYQLEGISNINNADKKCIFGIFYKKSSYKSKYKEDSERA